MAIEFCPLADEVGNLADWVAVVVGAIAAGATIRVAVLANRTSKRAAEIAAEAKDIAQQQHQEAVDAREANARIIGRLLFNETTALPSRLQRLVRVLERALEPERYSAHGLLFAVEEIAVPLLASAERVEDRIHTLPDLVGADLATMISHTRGIADAANRIKDSIEVHKATVIGTRTTYHFVGPPAQPESLLAVLKHVASLAPQFAEEFRTFVLTAGSADNAGT